MAQGVKELGVMRELGGELRRTGGLMLLAWEVKGRKADSEEIQLKLILGTI